MREQRKSSEIWIWRNEDDRKVLIPVRKLINRFLIATEGATGMESESRRYHIYGFFRVSSFANVPVRVKSKRNTFNFEKCTLYFPSKIITNSFLARRQKYTDDVTYDIFNMYCTSLYFYKMAFIIVKSSVWVLEWSDFFYFTSRLVL